MCACLSCFLRRPEVENMLEHGKKGICLSDSDMFQHFPTGSCTAQNNCNPGSRPLAYGYICIVLQNSGQSGHAHMGAAGMHSPEWRPCRLAGPRTEGEHRPQREEVWTHQSHPGHLEGLWSTPLSHRGGEKSPERGKNLPKLIHLGITRKNGWESWP